MNKSDAIKQIKNIFAQYKTITKSENRWLLGMQQGKVYELYCLSKTLGVLKGHYGYDISLVGSSIHFKGAPGLINASDPHFHILNHRTGRGFDLYTDIEFMTLGEHLIGASGPSTYHEIDLAVVEAGVVDRPSYSQVLLAVECKSQAQFKKDIIKQVLGVRRELSYLRNPRQSSLSAASPFKPNVTIPAEPASEYWVAFLDGKGQQYAASPNAFGVKFEHWVP